MKPLITVFAAITVALIASSGWAEADYVLKNGKIYTSDESQPWAEALAIEAENIVYLGDNKGARAFIDTETIVADLQGKMTMPGIIATHEHATMLMALSSGLTGWRCHAMPGSCSKT